jgi:hypothetical protein
VRLHASRSDHTCLFQVDENGDRDDDDDNVRVSQFIVEARSLKETLVFYIFERDEKGRQWQTQNRSAFFPRSRHPKTIKKAKFRKERLVAPISLSLDELDIQKSNLNKTTRKREETYLN